MSESVVDDEESHIEGRTLGDMDGQVHKLVQRGRAQFVLRDTASSIESYSTGTEGVPTYETSLRLIQLYPYEMKLYRRPQEKRWLSLLRKKWRLVERIGFGEDVEVREGNEELSVVINYGEDEDIKLRAADEYQRQLVVETIRTFNTLHCIAVEEVDVLGGKKKKKKNGSRVSGVLGIGEMGEVRGVGGWNVGEETLEDAYEELWRVEGGECDREVRDKLRRWELIVDGTRCVVVEEKIDVDMDGKTVCEVMEEKWTGRSDSCSVSVRNNEVRVRPEKSRRRDEENQMSTSKQEVIVLGMSDRVPVSVRTKTSSSSRKVPRDVVAVQRDMVSIVMDRNDRRRVYVVVKVVRRMFRFIEKNNSWEEAVRRTDVKRVVGFETPTEKEGVVLGWILRVRNLYERRAIEETEELVEDGDAADGWVREFSYANSSQKKKKSEEEDDVLVLSDDEMFGGELYRGPLPSCRSVDCQTEMEFGWFKQVESRLRSEIEEKERVEFRLNEEMTRNESLLRELEETKKVFEELRVQFGECEKQRSVLEEERSREVIAAKRATETIQTMMKDISDKESRLRSLQKDLVSEQKRRADAEGYLSVLVQKFKTALKHRDE